MNYDFEKLGIPEGYTLVSEASPTKTGFYFFLIKMDSGNERYFIIKSYFKLGVLTQKWTKAVAWKEEDKV